MSKLRLTLACGDYDFLSPLFDGTVKPAGVDLNVLTMASPERHGRMLRHEEFDVCELSLVGYLVARDRGLRPPIPHAVGRRSIPVSDGCPRPARARPRRGVPDGRERLPRGT